MFYHIKKTNYLFVHSKIEMLRIKRKKRKEKDRKRELLPLLYCIESVN